MMVEPTQTKGVCQAQRERGKRGEVNHVSHTTTANTGDDEAEETLSHRPDRDQTDRGRSHAMGTEASTIGGDLAR
jgi:hypothetical protein